MSLPNPTARLVFTYEELSLLAKYMDLDTATGEKQEILEKLYAKFETARAKLDPEQYKRD